MPAPANSPKKSTFNNPPAAYSWSTGHRTPLKGDKILFIFDGGQMSQTQAEALIVDGHEISKVEFHEAHTLQGLMPDRLARRLLTALDAAQHKQPTYAEHGVSPLGR